MAEGYPEPKTDSCQSRLAAGERSPSPIGAEVGLIHYRIYLLNPDGSIASGSDATCVDDDGARALACTMLGIYQQAEIWAGTRSLGKVEVSKQQSLKASRSR